MPTHPRSTLYWRQNRRVIGALLLVWFLVTFPLAWFAGDLDFSLFGWPFSFWMAAQGALFVYCVLICFYAWYMNRLDAQFGNMEDDPG